jgi:hypothetical protein
VIHTRALPRAGTGTADEAVPGATGRPATRVPRTGENRAGSTGSRSYRSGPVRKLTGNRSLTGPKKPGQTEPSGVPAGLPGFPAGFFQPCKPDGWGTLPATGRQRLPGLLRSNMWKF